MSTTKLKATQWAAQHTAGHETHGQTAIYDETTGKDVAIVYDGDAHAEFIVRAVNSHADMLEALEYISARIGLMLESGLSPTDGVGDMLTRWKAKADDAILKAKGEPR